MYQTSENFLEEFNSKIQASVVQTRYKKISNAAVLDLHNTPIEIVPAVPNRSIILLGSAAYKPAGTAFVVGATSFRLTWENAAGVDVFHATNAGFLDQTTEQARYGCGMFGAAGVTYTNVNLLTQAKPNVPVVARMSAAVTTGDSPLYVRVVYIEVPSLDFIG